MATAFFVLSACSSDLLAIRASLVFGFLGLVLAALSGYNTQGSFSYIPLSEGIINITMLINAALLLLNAYICVRLVRDELSGSFQDSKEKKLFNFFQARCGVTRIEFQEIYKNGRFLKLDQGSVVPKCRENLYLVLEGKVHCHCKFGGIPTYPFIKRSGEFFDIRLFNLFTFPIGFDNSHFEAHTLMPTKLYQWDLEGLKRMRENHMITPFWEFTVLRSLSAAGVKRHLQKTDTLYDSLCIPEDDDWLEGAPSRDFLPRLEARNSIRRQLLMMAGSMQVFPPHGVRHRPTILEPNPISAEDVSRSDQSETSITSHLGGNDEEEIPS
jgi:hypothetical protein